MKAVMEITGFVYPRTGQPRPGWGWRGITGFVYPGFVYPGFVYPRTAQPGVRMERDDGVLGKNESGKLCKYVIA